MIAPVPGKGPQIFIVAGEPSGDAIGGRLMAAIQERAGGKARFAGIGGSRMKAAGLIPLFPMSDLSVMGLGAVVERLPLLTRRLYQAIDDASRLRPNAVVTIDSPGFNFRLTRRLGHLGVPRIHYVAPTVWAWRPGRARTVARFLDHLLLLFPFEKPYFDAVGLAATYVGHPVIEEPIAVAGGRAVVASLGLAPDALPIVALPGSRPDEVRRLLPVFGATLGRLAGRRRNIAALVPTIDAVADQVAQGVLDWPVPVRVVRGGDARFRAFAVARAAIAAAGSVTLELAAAGVPTVVAYRTDRLTAFVARQAVTTPWVGLVNILAGEGAVPELLQDRCTPDAVAGALDALLDDGSGRAAQQAVFARVMAKLRDVPEPPSQTAARVILDAIERRP